jgi:flagellin
MSVINTNVSSLIAQRALAVNNQNLNTSLERLSTGLKINSGADDPAGLIASQSLQAEQTGLQSAISNATSADNVIGTAEGGLNEVSSLLTQLDGLVNTAANTGGLSSDEIAANQLQVDSILSTINRLAGSTSFNGKQLLDGNLDYTTSSAATSAFASLTINQATLPSNQTQSVQVSVQSAATAGGLTFTGGLVSGAVTLQIGGTTGTEQLSFGSGTTVAQIATAINDVTSTTGVTASATVGTSLHFAASDYGSANYVSIQALSGTFATKNSGGTVTTKSSGTDANVLVNGAKAEADGADITYSSNNLDLNFTLSTALNAHGKTKTFGVTGGGATFALGATVSDGTNASIGIQSVSTGSLGDATNGYLNTLGSGGANNLSSASLDTAQKIVSEAINQVSSLRGRLGAFQDFTIGSTINSLNVAYENASSAESAITNTDFAAETANLTRNQILSQAATSVLTQANSQPQLILKLLS